MCRCVSTGMFRGLFGDGRFKAVSPWLLLADVFPPESRMSDKDVDFTCLLVKIVVKVDKDFGI